MGGRISNEARLATVLAALALALACSGVAAASAQAGGYHVYACRTPAGQSAPADGWSGSKTGAYSYAEDTCSQPTGALVAALGDEPMRTANTDIATWAFSAPAGATIAGATLWRAGDADGGAAINATYQFWLAGPSENSDASTHACTLIGMPNGIGKARPTLGSENRADRARLPTWARTCT